MSTKPVSLGLKTKASYESIASITETIGTAMSGNPSFPAPPIAPAAMIKQAADLRGKAKVRDDAKAALAAANADLRATKKATQDMVVTQGHYVAIAAGGDETKARSAGVTLRPKPVRPKTLPAPRTPGVSLGDQPHQVKVRLYATKRPCDRRVETTTDPSKVDSWTLAGVTTGSSLVVSGLATGTHSFRVISVNADVSSPPSGVVTISVP